MIFRTIMLSNTPGTGDQRSRDQSNQLGDLHQGHHYELCKQKKKNQGTQTKPRATTQTILSIQYTPNH